MNDISVIIVNVRKWKNLTEIKMGLEAPKQNGEDGNEVKLLW